jgi:hypothetical protein
LEEYVNSIIGFWQIVGFFFIFIAGTLFHFLYDWTGRFKFVGLISPINESVWEHLKLVLYPTILFGIFEYLALKGLANNYVAAKAVSIVVAILAIVIIFYSYTYVLGRHYLFLDILTFAIAIALGQYVSYLLLTAPQLPLWVTSASMWILLILILLFSAFTFYPPRLPIFKNGPDGSYGIYGVK